MLLQLIPKRSRVNKGDVRECPMENDIQNSYVIKQYMSLGSEVLHGKWV